MCLERSPSAEVFFISGVSAAKVSFPSKPYAESPTTKKLPNLSAISCRPGDTVSLNTKWFQEGVVNESAAENAKKYGMNVVMDRCMMKEHYRHKH